jgi:hypothetical protein
MAEVEVFFFVLSIRANPLMAAADACLSSHQQNPSYLNLGLVLADSFPTHPLPITPRLVEVYPNFKPPMVTAAAFRTLPLALTGRPAGRNLAAGQARQAGQAGQAAHACDSMNFPPAAGCGGGLAGVCVFITPMFPPPLPAPPSHTSTPRRSLARTPPWRRLPVYSLLLN